jgi:hypothetical protein
LWIDFEKMEAPQSVTRQIISNAQDSAALLVILSKSYLNSEWVQKERDEFLKLLERRDENESIFVVEIDEIDRAELPPELNDLRTFRFWKPLDGGAPWLLGFPDPAGDQDYSDRVVVLWYQFARLLETSTRGRPPPSQGCGMSDHPTRELSESPKVFLAQVTDDLDKEAGFVRSFLEQQGVSVLPAAGVFYPPNQPDFEQEAEKDIAACQYFIQLLSGLVGSRPHGFPVVQCEVAKHLNKEIVQCRHPSVDLEDVEDEKHLELLNRDTVQWGSIEIFKQEILRVTSRKKSEAPRKDGLQSVFVFVDMDDGDATVGDQVCSVLKNEGIAFSKPLRGEDPQEIRNDLEENLRLCNGLIIIFGETTEAWVRRQVRQAQKALAFRESQPMTRGVCLAPPDNNKDPQDPVGMYLDYVADWRKEKNDRDILNFIDRLR